MSRSIMATLLLAAAVGCAGPASAAGFARVGLFGFYWEGVYTGARETALGGADLAGAASPDAVLINPAPLSRGDGIAASFGKLEGFPPSTDVETWAVAADWKGWRLSACRSGYEIGYISERTAYNPEGTSVLVDTKETMLLLGLSYEILGSRAGESSWRWAVGGAYRGYRNQSFDYESDGASFDLGTTLGWMRRFDTGSFEMRGALAWQNVTDATIDADGRVYGMPRTGRGGLSARTTLDWPGRQRDMLGALVAYSHVYRPGYPEDSNHLGVELVGGGVLALRYGTNDYHFQGVSGWGLGLILAEPFMNPLSVRADWGRLDPDNDFFDTLDVWGVEAAFAF